MIKHKSVPQNKQSLKHLFSHKKYRNCAKIYPVNKIPKFYPTTRNKILTS